jgi:hypothetical protein
MRRFPSVSLMLKLALLLLMMMLMLPPPPGVKRPPIKRPPHRELVCTNMHVAYGLAGPTIAPSRPPSHSAARQTWTMKTECDLMVVTTMVMIAIAIAIARTAKRRPSKGRTLRVLEISPWQSWHHFFVRLQLLLPAVRTLSTNYFIFVFVFHKIRSESISKSFRENV